MGNIGSTELLLVAAIACGLFVTPAVAAISAALHGPDVWRRAGFDGSARVIWVVLAIVLGPVGGLGYLVGVRPKLRAATTRA